MKKSKLIKMKRKIKKSIKSCPLAMLLVISTILLSGVGLACSLSKGQKPEVSMEYPMFTSLLAPNMLEHEFGEGEYIEESLEEIPTQGGVESELETISVAEETTLDNTTVQEEKQSDSAEEEYFKVGKEYFEDALFIGDSRVEGLKIYSELDNATFYCKEGISLTKILEEKIVKMKIKGKKKNVTIVKALKEKKFAKIYLMIGINEVGYRETDEFKKKYKEVVNKIKEIQPDAKIIILGMMKVTTEYAKENPSFSNANIQKKNDAISTLADNVDVFYLDFNPQICDSKGGVKKKYTWDGVHLKAEYYSIWVNFLKNHGV